MPRRRVAASGAALDADDAVLAHGVAGLQAELGVTPTFPADVEQEAAQAAGSPRLPALDRTDLPLVTIDPVGARDLDQAVHLARRGTGYRVHYAIADVAAFVRPGGAVDAEAHRRGETLYGLDAKVPLHPPSLSEEACSLRPEGDRPALLWTLDLDAEGERTAVRVERALVRSRSQLSYAGVQAELDAARGDPMFGLLRDVGELRLAREAARGGVSLPLPDQEVVRDGGRWRLEFRRTLPVESWNAQISLLTGMAAADLMLQGRVGVLRTVPAPDPRDVSRLRRVARALGIDWPERTSYPELIRGLDPALPKDAAMLTASTALLRGSGYVGFDGEVPEQRMHAAIAAPYTHVTAPLRRLVDRHAGEVCLALCAGQEVPGWVRERLGQLPETMRETSRRANAYDRGVLDLVEAAVLRDRVGEDFAAVVVDVGGRDPAEGDVVLREPAVEAPVRSDAGALPLGEEVTVRLTEADVARRRVRFAWRGRGAP